jgi:hypothetical protein
LVAKLVLWVTIEKFRLVRRQRTVRVARCRHGPEAIRTPAGCGVGAAGGGCRARRWDAHTATATPLLLLQSERALRPTGQRASCCVHCTRAAVPARRGWRGGLRTRHASAPSVLSGAVPSARRRTAHRSVSGGSML